MTTYSIKNNFFIYDILYNIHDQALIKVLLVVPHKINSVIIKC